MVHYVRVEQKDQAIRLVDGFGQTIEASEGLTAQLQEAAEEGLPLLIPLSDKPDAFMVQPLIEPLQGAEEGASIG